MIPFRVDFRPGVALYEQVVYAAKKSIVSGQLRPGDPFPSVRTLSKSFRINPNTAHKVTTQLIAEGLLEVRPGTGAFVAPSPVSTSLERSSLLANELEQVVVEAKKMAMSLDEVASALTRHWLRLEAPDGKALDRAARGRR